MNIFWNAQENRLRALWRLIIQFLLFFIISIVLGTIIGLIVAIKNFSTLQLDPNQAMEWAATLAKDPLILLLSLPLSFISVLLSMWICAKFIDKRPFTDFGFRFSGFWWKDFAFGLALGAALMTLIFLVELGLGWVKIDGYNVAANTRSSFGMGMLIMVVRFLFVGIYEEMLSRGYQLHNLAEGLRAKMSPKTAVILAWILSSFVFGLMHARNPNATWISTIYLIVSGLFLGFGYILTRELAIPIGLHITWNFFQGPVFGFPVSGTGSEAYFIKTTQLGSDLVTGGKFGPEAGLIGLAALALGSVLILLWVRATRSDASVKEELAIYSFAKLPAQPLDATPLPPAETPAGLDA